RPRRRGLNRSGPAPPDTSSITTPITQLTVETAAWLESARLLAVPGGADAIGVHHLAAVALRRGDGGDRLLSSAMNRLAIPAAVKQLVGEGGAAGGDAPRGS